MKKDHPKTNGELRKFGFVMAAALALLAGTTWWRQSPAWGYLAAAAGIFLSLALLAPGSLRLLEKAWMKLALVMGTIMTFVVLLLAFLFVFTPFGVIMRLFGRRPLSIGFDPKVASYWEPVGADSPYTRADKPY